MDRYTVYKHTDTHADVLAAIGAADVLRDLEPRIVDFEDRFEVRFRRPLRPSDLDAVDPGFAYLLRPKKTAPAAAKRSARIPCATATESRTYSILGRMKAYGGPNQVISRFAGMPREDWEEKVWEGFHGEPSFVFSSPLVQLFNPQAAKGYALLKPSGTNRNDKTKNHWAEPFTEWLRFRGYFEGSAGWFAAGDLRLFSPIPADMPYAELHATVASFREMRLGGTAVKIDCRAVLGLTRLLIQGAGTYRRPSRSMRGLWVTHYKDMGQAHTLMAMEQLAIPDWFELRTSQQAQLWLETLEEHDTVLRRLTDSHSDEFALLKQYRRTFQSRRQESIAGFVEFFAGYGALLYKRRAQGHWLLPQFTLRGVTALFERDPGLRLTVCNPGFLAVAAAIRSATVGAQAARHNGRPDHREIRYGLLSAIRRAGLLGKRELAEAVSALISDFNREAAARRAMGLRAGNIHSGEWDAFAAVLGGLPSAASAASLLCGLASCVRSERAALEADAELLQAIPA